MTPVRVALETRESNLVVYTVHVVNRSRHALHGAVRGAFRKYPDARRVEAEFLDDYASRLSLPASNRAHAQEA
jgi:hypothetical protein